jgi:hypothetical protein
MQGCEVVWGGAKARRVQKLIEEATGGPCGCGPERRCPFLPADFLSQIEAQPDIPTLPILRVATG